MAASTTPSLKATDLLAVKSRVSWGAIAAGAMVSLAIYFLMTLTGIVVGLEAEARRPDQLITLGLAIFSILTLLIAMFFGGWATSRLAVGETKGEAILYGIILWGVLFVGMLWLNSARVRVGFGAILGVASGSVIVTDDTAPAGASDNAMASTLLERFNKEDGDKFVANLTKTGLDEKQAKQVQQSTRDFLETLKTSAGAAATKPAEPGAADVMTRPREVSRQAAWYSLAGVVISMFAAVLGSLVGSGDLPVPVPILGVRRQPVDPRL